MSWFDRLRGELDADEAARRLQAAVDRSKIAAALAAASGPRGLRRYVVRFEVKAGRPRVVGLDTEPLPKGGGPPTPAAFDLGVAAVEAALQTLRVHMPPPFAWSLGAVGVVRDGDGDLRLAFRFDEDAAGFGVADLPLPAGPPDPMEDPAYLRALAAWEGRLAGVRARWVRPSAGEDWSIEGGALKLASPEGLRVLAVEPLATYADGTFTWLVDAPVADEAPFCEPELAMDVARAMELAVFAAARRGHAGLFSGELEEGGTLFAAVKQ
ncbi:MAG: hypothetical protein ACOZNI_28230 [Myxococcota bacterium]